MAIKKKKKVVQKQKEVKHKVKHVAKPIAKPVAKQAHKVKKVEHKVEHKQEHVKMHVENHTKVYGILGMAFSLAAFVSLVLSYMFAIFRVAVSTGLSEWLFIVFLIALLVSLVFCVIQSTKKSNIYSKLGTIFSSILVILFIIFILAA